MPVLLLGDVRLLSSALGGVEIALVLGDPDAEFLSCGLDPGEVSSASSRSAGRTQGPADDVASRVAGLPVVHPAEHLG